MITRYSSTFITDRSDPFGLDLPFLVIPQYLLLACWSDRKFPAIENTRGHLDRLGR
jgi:hypothetical protein